MHPPKANLSASASSSISDRATGCGVPPRRLARAMKAGIRASDIIIEVDGTKTEGLSRSKSRSCCSGRKGIRLSDQDLRPSTGENARLHIVRQKIEINCRHLGDAARTTSP